MLRQQCWPELRRLICCGRAGLVWRAASEGRRHRIWGLCGWCGCVVGEAEVALRKRVLRSPYERIRAFFQFLLNGVVRWRRLEAEAGRRQPGLVWTVLCVLCMLCALLSGLRGALPEHPHPFRQGPRLACNN